MRLMQTVGFFALTLLFCLSPALQPAIAETDGQNGDGNGDHHDHSGGIRRIQHIVFIIKENRTFDNYFGTFPGADGATTGTISTGQVVPLGRTPDRIHDISHSWQGAIQAMDGGRMDRFDIIQGGSVNGDLASYTQNTSQDLPNLFAYARHFVIADRMFSSLQGPSFPNHLYTVAAQSGSAINNPHPGGWGCDAAASSTVEVLQDDG